MKPVYSSAKAKPTLFNLLFWLVILILYACGNGGSGGDDSLETGSVTFGLVLDESGAIRALSTRQLDDENGQFECRTAEYEIDKIEAQVVDENDDILAEGGPFNCEDREGSVDGVEAGDNRILKVFAKNPDGIVIFGGESGFFSIQGGQTTEVGTITLNREEVPPEANNDTETTDEDVAKIIDVLANDGDANGDSLTISKVTQGRNGSVTITSDRKSLTYSPNKDFNGSDSFTYTISDGTAADDATVDITVRPVNDAPEAKPDIFSTNEDIEVSGNVLDDNGSGADSDIEKDPLTAILVSNVTRGILTLESDGAFTYSPDPNFNGRDFFTYKANDGSLNSNEATVTVNVSPVNDPPVAENDSIDGILVFSVDSELDVLNNDDDPADGDPLIITDADLTTARGGTVTVNPAKDRLLYTPAVGFFGVDSFQYTIEDDPGGTLSSQSDTATVRVNVIAPITRVSVDSAGVEVEGSSFNPAVSANGRFVAFQSNSDNLVDDDANGFSDIFVYDRVNQNVERVSVVSIELIGDDLDRNADGASANPSISRDGLLVAFQSAASNLVADDNNGFVDIFVYDRGDQSVKRLSLNVNPGGDEGSNANGNSSNPSISADGEFIAFESFATNLVTGDSNESRDVFVRDLRGPGTTELISVNSAEEQANNASFNPSISADGLLVAFESSATNLILDDTGGPVEDINDKITDIFVRDRSAGTTELVSVDTAEQQANAASSNPSISADGDFVAFDSFATNLVTPDLEFDSDIFIRIRIPAAGGITERVNETTDEEEPAGSSFNPAISSDGRYVAFESSAANFIADDTSGTDIFVYDRFRLTIDRVSEQPGGNNANEESFNPAVSADGRHVAFDSKASDLIDNDTNFGTDVFEAGNPLFAP